MNEIGNNYLTSKYPNVSNIQNVSYIRSFFEVSFYSFVDVK